MLKKNTGAENIIFVDTLKKIILEEIAFLKAHGDEENVHPESIDLIVLAVYFIPLAQIT